MQRLTLLGLLLGLPPLACNEPQSPPPAGQSKPPLRAARTVGKGREVLQGLSQPGAAGHHLLTTLQPRELSPAEEASNLAKLDLGPRGEFFPTELEVLSFGMSPRALLRARPAARLEAPFVRKRRGHNLLRRIATEEAPPQSPYLRFRYHFSNRKLVAIFAWLRLEHLTKALLEKARKKWGRPRADAEARRLEKYHALRGAQRKEWRLRRGRVRLERPRFERRVRLYFARR